MNRIFAIILAVAAFGVSVSAQTNEFNYQGSLNFNGIPANGSFDFEFRLFGSESGGTQIGGTVTRTAVSVVNGSFGVTLSIPMLGPVSAFSGPDRWIEIAVRQNGSGSGFQQLSPRSKVTSAPYSITASNALNLNGFAASQYVQTNDSRLTDSRNPLPGSANYIQNSTVSQPSSNFNISGDGTVGGKLAVGNGTAVSPSFTFGADTNTGIFRSNANTLNFATNGVSRMQIDASGNTSFGGNITIPITSRYVHLSSVGFTAERWNMNYSNSGSVLRGENNGQAVAFSTPLLLPDGAVITELRAYIIDNDETHDITIDISKSQPGLGSLSVASVTSNGGIANPRGITTSTISSGTIDNENFMYFLRTNWTVPNNSLWIGLISVRVTYTITSPLP